MSSSSESGVDEMIDVSQEQDENANAEVEECVPVYKKQKVCAASQIKFNVGGKPFEVSRSFLELHEDTMLAKLASDRWMSKNPEDDIFIDRDGERFTYVLDFLRHGDVFLPVTITRESFLADLDFYNVGVVDKTKIQYSPNNSGYSFLQQVGEDVKKIKQAEKKLAGLKEKLRKKQDVMRLATICFNCLQASSAHPKLELKNFPADHPGDQKLQKKDMEGILALVWNCFDQDEPADPDMDLKECRETKDWFDQSLSVYNLKLKHISTKPSVSKSFKLRFELALTP